MELCSEWVIYDVDPLGGALYYQTNLRQFALLAGCVLGDHPAHTISGLVPAREETVMESTAGLDFQSLAAKMLKLLPAS
jgi:hypothetical protein